MPCKVLVVDDSTFFQIRLKEIVDSHPDLMVVGIANNGWEAIKMAKDLKPDVISMDYDMPYMDGVSAVREIMAHHPIPIVMFSSLTYEGARITLEALEAGAVDFLPKNFADISKQSGQLRRRLQESLLNARQAHAKAAGFTQSIASNLKRPVADRPARAEPVPEIRPTHPQIGTLRKPSSGQLKDQVQLLLIGASTGGPVAVTEVLMRLPKNFSLPVVVVQHMPAYFTKVFAERLNSLCALNVRQAQNGDMLEAGVVLVAPGAQQLLFDRNKRGRIKTMAADERLRYSPSVDIAFGSAASVFTNRVLAVVLTGMGHDGCQGARLLKQKGAFVWSQDENSCVVYGMPKAVATAGLTDRVLSLAEVGPRLCEEFC